MQTSFFSLIGRNRYTVILVALVAMLFLTGFQSSSDCDTGPQDCTHDSFFGGCHDPLPGEGAIEALVTAVADLTPLPGATVAIDSVPPQSYVTSLEGPPTFLYLPPRTYTLNVSRTGYLTKSVALNLIAGETLKPRIELSPVPGSIAGKVTDAKSNAAIAGATVSLSAAGNPVRTTATDAAGLYRFDNVPVGVTVTVRATADKYDPKDLPAFVFGPGDNKTGQDFALTQAAAAAPTGSLTVTLLDATTGAKAPLGSINAVTFGGVPLALRTSDSTFNLAAAAAGANLPLVASATGFTTATRNVTVTAGQAQTITIPLSPVFPTTSAAPVCESAGKSYRITLDWQRDSQNRPTDLDLLLVAPRPNSSVGCYLDNDNRGSLCSSPNALLRVENVHTTGSPTMEAVDISQLNSGTYLVVVNDYSGEVERKEPASTLGDPKTAATVTVYGPKGVVTATAPPAPAAGYWYWIPFTINGATGEVTPANPAFLPAGTPFAPNECP